MTAVYFTLAGLLLGACLIMIAVPHIWMLMVVAVILMVCGVLESKTTYNRSL